ncbi:DUF3102 domain-containing protein [Gemmata sp.]|uniref:DUF3102 domain-containing protein n=1 Tax=Gemmata sp. TaxID=1914242 RepID=UPI003F725CF9
MVTQVHAPLAIPVTDTTDETAAPFDYAGMAEPDRAWLHRAAAELRVRLRRSVGEVLEAGRVLARARKRLGRGKWEPWLAAEAQVPRRSASRLLAVHRAFGAADPDVLRHVTPTAMYALSEPGVPQSLREYAVEQAADGHAVTATQVRTWLELHRDDPVAPLKLASKDPPHPPAHVDADAVHAADNWAALVAIFAEDVTLHVARTTDVENGDRTISAAVLGAAGARRTATGSTLEAVVLTLAGEKRTKVCRGRCRAVKELREFSKRVDSPDGRNHYCLQCEATRVKEYDKRKAEKRGGPGGRVEEHAPSPCGSSTPPVSSARPPEEHQGI